MIMVSLESPLTICPSTLTLDDFEWVERSHTNEPFDGLWEVFSMWLYNDGIAMQSYFNRSIAAVSQEKDSALME